jgi:hypothetical protein
VLYTQERDTLRNSMNEHIEDLLQFTSYNPIHPNKLFLYLNSFRERRLMVGARQCQASKLSCLIRIAAAVTTRDLRSESRDLQKPPSTLPSEQCSLPSHNNNGLNTHSTALSAASIALPITSLQPPQSLPTVRPPTSTLHTRHPRAAGRKAGECVLVGRDGSTETGR